jgi:tight adherence protein B
MKRSAGTTPSSLASLVALPGVIAALRAGAPPEVAWEEWPAAVVASDGTVIVPGDAPSSASLTAASRLARTTGAPLSEILEAVSAVLRDEADAALRRESALAGPRASATVLSWLPVVGVAMSALVEPASVRLLVATPMGWLLLALAAGLWWAGRRWMKALVDRAVAAGQAR